MGVIHNLQNPYLGLGNRRRYWEGGGIEGDDCITVSSSDNPALYVEYCRIVRTTGNVRIKPIIIDKLCDMVSVSNVFTNVCLQMYVYNNAISAYAKVNPWLQVRDVHSLKPKLVEQITLPVITDNTEMLQGYVGRLCTLLHQVIIYGYTAHTFTLYTYTVHTVHTHTHAMYIHTHNVHTHVHTLIYL